jgi:hypothetical protein
MPAQQLLKSIDQNGPEEGFILGTVRQGFENGHLTGDVEVTLKDGSTLLLFLDLKNRASPYTARLPQSGEVIELKADTDQHRACCWDFPNCKD